MANKRLIASIALTAGLVGGGAAGLILGVPGVSAAQTTTVPNDGQTNPDRPPRANGENCPDKGGTNSGQAPTGSSNSNTGFSRATNRV